MMSSSFLQQGKRQIKAGHRPALVYTNTKVISIQAVKKGADSKKARMKKGVNSKVAAKK